MEHVLVQFRGCPIPVQESLIAGLRTLGAGEMWDPDRHGDDDVKAKVVLVYCSTETQWELVDELVRAGDTVVAMIVDLGVEVYARALQLRAAGVVHFDTSSAMVVSVIQSAIQGEVVLPAYAAWSLTTRASPNATLPTEITPIERQLLSALIRGDRIAEIADMLCYSDRTIRRRLQNLYLKIGAKNRHDAVRLASRFGLEQDDADTDAGG